MGIVFGISKLSFSGVCINGVVKIVPNKIGERITQSIILFKKKGQINKKVLKEDVLVGEETLKKSIWKIRNYVYEIKRFIGLDYEELLESGFNESLNSEIVNEARIPNIKI